jgi:hypothetical protein
MNFIMNKYYKITINIIHPQKKLNLHIEHDQFPTKN